MNRRQHLIREEESGRVLFLLILFFFETFLVSIEVECRADEPLIH